GRQDGQDRRQAQGRQQDRQTKGYLASEPHPNGERPGPVDPPPGGEAVKNHWRPEALTVDRRGPSRVDVLTDREIHRRRRVANAHLVAPAHVVDRDLGRWSGSGRRLAV